MAALKKKWRNTGDGELLIVLLVTRLLYKNFYVIVSIFLLKADLPYTKLFQDRPFCKKIGGGCFFRVLCLVDF